MAANQVVPVQYLVRLIGRKCRLKYGEGACTADGDTKCYNTESTCQVVQRSDVAPVFSKKIYRFSLRPQRGYRPMVTGVTMSTGEVNMEGLGSWPEAEITLADSSAADQSQGSASTADIIASDDPYERFSEEGTYWGRFLARNRDFRSWYAEVDIINSELSADAGEAAGISEDAYTGGLVQRTRWKIDNIEGRNKGEIVLVLSSPDRDYFENPYPAESSATLSADVGDSGQFTITNIPSNWSRGRHLRIGTEIVALGTVVQPTDDGGGSAQVDFRGTWGTEAAVHSAGDTAQLCESVQGPLAGSIYNILLDAEISPDLIDDESFNGYDRDINPGSRMNGIFSREVKVKDALAEACQVAQAGLIWDIFRQRYVLIGETVWSQATASIDENDFVEGSFRIRRRPDLQITRGRIKHNLKDATDDRDFSTTRAFVGNREDVYETKQETLIESRLLGVKGVQESPSGGPGEAQVQAAQVAIARKVQRYQDIPVEVNMDLLESVASSLFLGQICDIRFPSVIQRFGGEASTVRAMLVSMELNHLSASRTCKFVSIAPAPWPNEDRPALYDYVIEAGVYPESGSGFNLFNHMGRPSEVRSWRVRIEYGAQFHSSDPAVPAFDVGEFPEGTELRIELNDGAYILGGGGGGGDPRTSATDTTTDIDGRRGGTAFYSRPGHNIKVTLLNRGNIWPGGGGGGAGAFIVPGDHGVRGNPANFLRGGHGGKGAAAIRSGDPKSLRGGFEGASRPEDTGNPLQFNLAARGGFAGSGGDYGAKGSGGERATYNRAGQITSVGTAGEGGPPGRAFDIDTANTQFFTEDQPGGAAGLNQPKVDFTLINQGFIRGRYSDDIEAGEIIVSSEELTIPEGESRVITVRLSAKPRGDVSISVTSSHSRVNPDVGLLRFNEANWDIPQTVRILTEDDKDAEDIVARVSMLARGGGYEGVRKTIKVSVTDDDVQGILVAAELMIIDEGDSATNTVRLRRRPDADIVVNLTTVGTRVTFEPNQLTFGPATWETPQVVTFTAGADSDAVENTETVTLASPPLGLQANRTITVRMPDTGETVPPVTGAAFVFSPSPVTVTEGSTATVGISLAAQPSGTVTVYLSKTPESDFRTNVSTLTFTPQNWSTAQEVTIIPDDDDDAQNETGKLVAYAFGGGYGNGADSIRGEVIVNTLDDDDAAIVVSDLMVTVTEGFEGSFTAHLNRAPVGGDTTVAITASNSKVIIQTASLTFTSADWETPQTVRFLGARDDDIVDDASVITLTATGGGITAQATVMVSVIDVDKPRLVINRQYFTGDHLEINEESFNSVGVRLGTKPALNVTVSVSLTGPFTHAPSSFTFTPENWRITQWVTVRAPADANAVNETGTLTFAADANYNRVTQTILLRSLDTEGAPRIFLVDGSGRDLPLNSPLIIGEGQRVYSRVRLSKRPTGDVTVTVTKILTFGTADDLTFSPSTLLFTQDNWAVPQRLFSEVAENDTEGVSERYIRRFTAAGGGYDGVTRDQDVSVVDDDFVRLNFSRRIVFVPEGGSNTFSVSLPFAPPQPVTVGIERNFGSLITANPASLTFTPANFATPQTFTLASGSDENDDSETELFLLSIDTPKDDPNYERSAYDDYVGELITAVSIDTTINGWVLSPTSLADIPEGEHRDFTIRGEGTTTEDITLTLSLADGDESAFSISAETLTFTVSNFTTPQTVRVTAKQDFNSFDEVDFINIVASGNGGSEDRSTRWNYAVSSVDDDDPAGIDIAVYPNDAYDAVPVIRDWVDARVGRVSQPCGVRLTRAPDPALGPVTVSVFSNVPGVTILPYLGQGQSLFGDTGGNIFLPTDANDNRRASEIAADGISAFSRAEGSFYVTDDQGRVVFTNEEGETVVGGTDPEGAPEGFRPQTQFAQQLGELKRLDELAQFFSNQDAQDRERLAAILEDLDLENTLGFEQRRTLNGIITGVLGVAGAVIPGIQGLAAANFSSLLLASELGIVGTKLAPPVVVALANLGMAVQFSTTATGVAVVSVAGSFGTFLVNTGLTASEELQASYEQIVENYRTLIEIGVQYNEQLKTIDSLRQTVDRAAQSSGINRYNINQTITETQRIGLTGGGITQRAFTFPTAELTEQRPDGTSAVRAWNAYQRFVVYPIPGTPHGGTATLTFIANGGGYTGQFTELTVNLLEPNAAGLVLDPAAQDIAEGASGTINVRSLSLPPRGIAINAEAGPGLSVSPTSVARRRDTAFDPIPFTVQTTQDDDANDDIRTVTFRLDGGADYQAQETASITVVDDETRAIISGSGTGFTMTEGGTQPLMMRLSARPVGGSVTISFASDNTDVTVSPTSLVYTDANWNTNQTVIVRAAVDATQDDETATLTATATGADWGATGVSRSWSISITDSTVSPPTVSTTNLTISEGGSANVTVTLQQAPTGTATLSYTSTNPDIGSATQISFTPQNWQQGRTVTISAADDFDSDNDTGIFSIAVNGGGYNGESVSINVTVTDNDQPAAVQVSATSLTILEGASGAFNVRLSAKPDSLVTLTIASDDVNVTTSSSSLSFTASNWDIYQSITVSASDDEDLVNETVAITCTANGGGYSGESATVTVTVTDTDQASIQFSGADATFVEGQARNLGVRLSHKPASNVSLTFSGDGFTHSPSSMIFTDTTWSTVQNLSITPNRDDDASDETISVTATAQGSGSGYQGVTGGVNLTVDDIDTRGIVFQDDNIQIDEDSSGNIGFRLTSQPTADVQVVLSISPSGGNLSFTGGTNSRTFTSSNWSTYQFINLTNARDPNAVEETFTITATATGGDYAGVTQTATVRTDETNTSAPALILGATSITLTEGASTGYALHFRINNEPSSDVTVTVSKTGDIALNYSATSFTFTPGNYNTNQVLRITSPDDGNATDESGTLTLTCSGGGYAGVSAGIPISVTDDDETEIRAPGAPYTLTEGGSFTVQISLGSAPTANVTVTPADSSGNGLTFSPATLTFTPSNGQTAQSLVITAPEDDGDDVSEIGNITYTASGGDYNNVTATAAYEIQDNDYTIEPLTLSATTVNLTEGGAGVDVTVRLTNTPLSNRTVNIADESGRVAASPATLNFTPSNATTAQTVRLTANQDANIMDEVASVTLSGAGIVTTYITANITDDDEIAIVTDADTIDTVGGAFDLRLGVRLDSQPNTTVQVRYSDDVGWISTPSPISFTAQNWQTVQYFRLQGGADPGTGTRTAAITLRASGGDYDGITKSVTLRQDRTLPNLTLSATTLALVEGGASGQVNIKLSESITLPRTITPKSDNPDVTFSPATLTYTSANWNTNQALTITANDDAGVADDTAIISFAGPGTGSNTATITVSVDDDDTLGINLSRTNIVVTEGTTDEDRDTAVTSVTLNSQPTGTVTVTPSIAGNDDISFEPASRTFTPENYSTGQSFTVKARRDADTLNETGTITFTASGADYEGLTATASVTVQERRLMLVFTPATVSIAENGGSASIDCKPDEAPARDRTWTISPSGDITVTPTTLTFGTANWETVQTITVTASPDADTGDDTAFLNFSGAGDAAIASQTYTVTIEDSTPANIVVTPAEVNVGESQTFTISVSLSNPPPTGTAVTVTVSSSDTDVVDVQAVNGIRNRTATWTTGQYSQSRTFTFAVEGDADYEDETATLTFTGSGAGTGYASATTTVNVNVSDPFTGQVLRIPDSSLSTVLVGATAGESVTFAVLLESAPDSNVSASVNVYSQFANAGWSVTPVSETWTPTDWNTATAHLFTLAVPAGVTLDPRFGHRAFEVRISPTRGLLMSVVQES